MYVAKGIVRRGVYKHSTCRSERVLSYQVHCTLGIVLPKQSGVLSNYTVPFACLSHYNRAESIASIFLIKLFIIVCVTCMFRCMCSDSCVNIRGQLYAVCSLFLPLHGFQESNSAC